MQTRFLKGLAARALSGRLAHLKEAAGHSPEAIVFALDEQDVASSSENGGITDGIGGLVTEIRLIELFQMVRITALLTRHYLGSDAKDALKPPLGVGIFRAPTQPLVGNRAQFIGPQMKPLSQSVISKS